MENKALQKLMDDFSISSRELELLTEGAEKRIFAPRQVVVREGETDSNLYLITQGVWRAYSFKDGVEMTLWFAEAGEFAFSTWGYVAGAPSMLTLEAITRSEACVISRQQMEKLFGSSIGMAALGRRILEKFILTWESAWLASNHRTAGERYLTLLEEHPGIIRTVPLKYIASYLGITVQSLSRIRTRLADY